MYHTPHHAHMHTDQREYVQQRYTDPDPGIMLYTGNGN